MKKRKRGENKSPQNPLFLDDEVSVRLTGTGDLIDVRCTVNPEMLAPGPVYIQDEATGKMATVLSVPRIGRLMTQRSEVNNIAYGIFLNPEESIKAGSLITLVMGGFKREHIKVIQ